MKNLILAILLFFTFFSSYGQRTIKTKFYITSKIAQQNNGSGYNYHFDSGYGFDIDLYIYTTNNFEANPILRNENKLPMYLSSPNDKLILSCKINKYNQIDVFLPRYGTYKLIAINNSFGRKMVANIGGPCIDCGETNVSIQLNEDINRQNITLANYDYDSALVYVYDDNTEKLDFNGGNFSLPYNSLLTDVYNYKRERLIYSFNIPKNSSYKLYLPEGKFHFIIFNPTTSSKGTLNVDVPYNSPNYDAYKIQLTQKMPMKWSLPTTSNGLQVGEPKSQSSNKRVSKEEYEKVNGKTTMTIITEEEILLEEGYTEISFDKSKVKFIYQDGPFDLDFKKFEIILPDNNNFKIGDIQIQYQTETSGDNVVFHNLKVGKNIIEGRSIIATCNKKVYSCNKIYYKEK